MKSINSIAKLSPRSAVRSVRRMNQIRREKKVYSGMATLPQGHSSEKIVPGCMVIEGGAFRGLYNQGVLDYLMEQDITLQTTIGVSAGALAGMNYVSGQIGRSAHANLGHRHESGYIGAKALRKSHSLLRLDYLLKDYNRIDPLDDLRFYDPNRRFVAVASNLRTGTTEYFEKGKCRDIMSAIKASASMPYISPAVMVDGEPCLDGGCTCKIAYQWALDHDFEKIVVIRTREHGFRKTIKETHTAEKFYAQYPTFAEKLDESNAMYNRQCEQVEELQAAGRIYVIEPSEPVTVGRIESDMEKLGDLYWLGYHDAEAQIGQLREYLGI